MAQRLTALASLVLLVLVGWAVGTRASVPSDGTVVHLSDALWNQDRIRISYVVGVDVPLQAGDDVVAVASRDDGAFTYTVIRDGTRQDVTVQLGPFSLTRLARQAWSSLLTVVLLFGIGWFVFARRPRDPAARTLLLASSLFAFGTCSWLLGDQVLQLALDGPRAIDVLGELALALVWGAAAHFAVVTPGTTLRPGRRTIAALYALPVLLYGGFLLYAVPTADGRLETMGRLAQVSLLPSVVLPVFASGLMLLSYRRTPDGPARQRLRGVLIAFLISAAAVLSLWVLPMLWSRPLLDVILLPTALLLPAIALPAAVLRYRLFDIEIILRRSLLTASLTAAVLAIYLTVGSVVGRLTGAGPGLAAVVSTCLVAFSFHPLRAWLQSRIGRLIYGSRDDPFTVVSRLGRVDVAAAPQAVLSEVAHALAQALRLSYVAIELHTRQGLLAADAESGNPSGEPFVIELRQGGDTIGKLLLDVGPSRERFGPADRRLLHALTRHIGSAAAVVLLNAELRESRQRLVLAREEERRHIFLTLRDGLEADLTAHGERLAAARRLIADDPQAALAMLNATISSTRAVIGDVRSLVGGLRPPALDQLGLVGAIRERLSRLSDEADGAMPARLEVVRENDLGPLPAAVEVAAFWIAVEAARHATVTGPDAELQAVLARRGDLLLHIRHDGGFTPGPGLAGAAQRAEELGGSMTTTATTVRSRLPIREMEVTR